MRAFTTNYDKSKWLWTLMIMTPDWITKDMFQDALDCVSEKKKPESLDKLRLSELNEGKCVQTLSWFI